MDCYLAKILGVKGHKEFIATIDFANGSSWSAPTRKDKELAQKDLDKAIEKYKVNLIPDTRGNKDALSKEERVFVHECMEKRIEYKSKLLESRIMKRRLTEIEMRNMLSKKETI